MKKGFYRLTGAKRTTIGSYVQHIKRRLMRRLFDAYKAYQGGFLSRAQMDQRVQSYLGILSHANEYHLSELIQTAYGVR